MHFAGKDTHYSHNHQIFSNFFLLLSSRRSTGWLCQKPYAKKGEVDFQLLPINNAVSLSAQPIKKYQAVSRLTFTFAPMKQELCKCEGSLTRNYNVV